MPEATDYADELDYNALKISIKQILLKYFESDDNGNQSPFYDPNFSAQDAIDEIHYIIGDI